MANKTALIKAIPAEINLGNILFGDTVITFAHLVNYGDVVPLDYPVMMINSEKHMVLGAVVIDLESQAAVLVASIKIVIDTALLLPGEHKIELWVDTNHNMVRIPVNLTVV